MPSLVRRASAAHIERLENGSASACVRPFVQNQKEIIVGYGKEKLKKGPPAVRGDLNRSSRPGSKLSVTQWEDGRVEVEEGQKTQTHDPTAGANVQQSQPGAMRYIAARAYCRRKRWCAHCVVDAKNMADGVGTD